MLTEQVDDACSNAVEAGPLTCVQQSRADKLTFAVLELSISVL